MDGGRPLQDHGLRHRSTSAAAARHARTRRGRSRTTSATSETHPAFSDGPVALDACAYLHNAEHDPKSPLYLPAFAALIATNPPFAGDQTDRLATFLDARVAGPDDGGGSSRVATRLPPAQAPARPRRARDPPRAGLHAPRRTAGRLQRIVGSVRAPGQNQQKVAFIVAGGPGTGKSVIAVNLVAELSALEPPDPSRHRLQGVHREPAQDRRPTRRRDVQLLPRHRPMSTSRSTPSSSTRPIASGRSAPAGSPREGAHGQGPDRRHPRCQPRSVFFIDDLQVVRPGEVGSTDLIRRPPEARLDVRASTSSRRSSARTAPTRSSTGSTTRSSLTGRRRCSGRPRRVRLPRRRLDQGARGADPRRAGEGATARLSPASAGPGPTRRRRPARSPTSG